MKNLKNQKGITLVALVITIIVLLILAGISLNLVVGQNGILGRTKSAVATNDLASVQEQANLVLVGLVEEWVEAVNVKGEEWADVRAFMVDKTATGTGHAREATNDGYYLEVTSNSSGATTTYTVTLYDDPTGGNAKYAGTLNANGMLDKNSSFDKASS